MTAPGSSTCYMEQRSSDHIIADVNDENIAKGQCHHFSIREYVRQMQMSNSMFCSLSDEHINSSLVTTKIYRQWNCKGCWDKLEPLYNTTPARTLNEFARVPEHAVRKELSPEKSSAKCHSPSSYNKESTEADRAIHDFHESTPINQENGSVKYISPSWDKKEPTDANPVVNGTCEILSEIPMLIGSASPFISSFSGLDEASPSNADGTKKTPSNVLFMDYTNRPDTCQKIKDKKEINDKEKLEFLHGDPVLERSKKGNNVKSLPVKRKDETHGSLHNKEKNMFKTYKRRKSTKVHDFINDSSYVDSQNRSESNRAGNSKEKHVLSIMQPDGSLLRPGVCLSEGKIPHTTNIMDGGESIGVYQIPCSSENELEFSMNLSEVSPGKSEQTHRKTTEDEEDERAIISVKGASTKVQSEKSNPEFSQLEQQQSQHLHNELPLSITEDEKDDCVITSVKEVSTRLQSGKLQNHLSKEEAQIPDVMWSQHQQFQLLHNEVPLGNATEDEYDVSTRLQCGESHNQYNGENFTPYSDSTNLNGSFAPIMDISAKYQHPQNSSKPIRHVGYVTPVSILEPERVSSHSTKGKSKIVDQSSEEDICALSLSLPRRP